MVESDFNRILTHTVNHLPRSRAHKISDGAGGKAVQNPFDSFGILFGLPAYIESKYVKGLYAFNLSRIEDHQYDNLEFYGRELSESGIPHYCLIPVFFYSPREMKRVLFFDFEFINSEHKKGVSSFKQKTIISWMEQGFFFDIKALKFLNEEGKEVRKDTILDLTKEALDKKIIKCYV